MQKEYTACLNLQLFADGAATAGANAGATSTDGGTTSTGDFSTAFGIPAKAKRIVDEMQNKCIKATEANKKDDISNKNGEKASDAQSERKSFKELIDSEEYSAEAKEYMNNAFKKRMSKYKGVEAENAKMREILEMQSMRYNLDVSSDTFLEDYKSAVENDTKLFEDEALERGMSVEDLIKLKQAEQITIKNRRESENKQRNEVLQKSFSRIMAEAETMKSKYPNLDIEAELNNQAFCKLVNPPELGGVNLSVEDAYFALHHNDIMHNALTNAINTATINTANAVQANRSRPSEGGLSQTQAVVTKVNPASLTLADFRRIRDDYRNKGVKPQF